jgi:hypothetical protein
MSIDEALKCEIARLRRTVIDDFAEQLRQGRLDLDGLTSVNEAELWYVQHQ